MKVSLASENDRDDWDHFVRSHPDSSIYHTHQWKNILESTFGYRSRFLMAKDGRQVVDVLPLYLIDLFSLRKKMVGIPLSGSYPAFLSADRKAHSMLIEQAVSLARNEGVQYLEIRSNTSYAALQDHGFIERHPFHFAQIEVRDLQANRKMLSHGHKLSIGKAARSGVSVEPSRSKNDLKAVYAVMEKMYREFGTPLFGYAYLEHMWDELMPRDQFLLLVIRHGGEIIGGGCNCIYQDQMIYKYGAYLPSKRNLCPFPALYWRGIEECVRRGLRSIDLGASSEGDRGLRQFKSSWGASETAGCFYYLPVKGKPPEMGAYLDSFQIVKKIWKRLPQSALRAIGPFFYKWIC